MTGVTTTETGTTQAGTTQVPITTNRTFTDRPRVTTSATATTLQAPNGVTTQNAAEVAAALAELRRKARLLEESENDLRLGIGIGIAAFIAALLLAVACVLGRGN
jgi:hypothetical protein